MKDQFGNFSVIATGPICWTDYAEPFINFIEPLPCRTHFQNRFAEPV